MATHPDSVICRNDCRDGGEAHADGVELKLRDYHSKPAGDKVNLAGFTTGLNPIKDAS